MSKRPSFQFYPSDWRTEAGLRLCSLAARGLWIEMLTLMHEGEPYGHLTIDGEQISVEMLSRLIGETPNLVKKLLKELEARKVFSRTDDGTIFSRRMVRDEDARERRAAGGSAGAAHGYKGASHGSKGGRPRKDKTPEAENIRGDKKPPSTPVSKPPPSSSSSSSSSNPLPPSYHFEGRTIRLNKADYDQWAEAFPFIPDLTAELESIDLWLGKADDVTRKRWFHAVSRMLERSNKEHAAAAKARSEEEERFNRRFPERELTESDARALMTPEEFNRWERRRAG